MRSVKSIKKEREKGMVFLKNLINFNTIVKILLQISFQTDLFNLDFNVNLF